MKKDFILDDGKIRNCPKNIAMMNILEYILFDVFEHKCLKHGFIETMNQYYEGIKILCFAIINSILLIIFPITIIFKWYHAVKECKMQMKKYN